MTSPWDLCLCDADLDLLANLDLSLGVGQYLDYKVDPRYEGTKLVEVAIPEDLRKTKDSVLMGEVMDSEGKGSP